jgi:hypothetical protein
MKFLSAARYSIGERELPFTTGILYRWRICSVRYAVDGAFTLSPVSRCPTCPPPGPSTSHRRPPPDLLAACALVGSLLGGRLPEEEGRGNKERRPRRPSPAPGRAAAARDAFAARNASVLCSPATLRAALSSEKREHKRERHRNG